MGASATKVAPAFRRKALDERLATMHEIVDAEVHAIPVGDVIDAELAMGRIALRVAAWVLFGEQLDSGRAEELAEHQRHMVQWVGHRIPRASGTLPFAVGPAARDMRAHSAVLRDYVDEVIARRRRAPTTTGDVLGALIDAVAPKRLRGQVLGLLFAGNETTASAMCWLIVHGANNPAAWARVRNDPEHATDSFVAEAMRLSPPAWGIPRAPASVGARIDGQRVGASQVAMIYLRAIFRDKGTWADPLRFDPSRHGDPDKEQQRALVPFGLGPRGCIGQYLAMAEISEVLPALARRGDVQVDQTVIEDPKFALRVAGGLHARFTPIH